MRVPDVFGCGRARELPGSSGNDFITSFLATLTLFFSARTRERRVHAFGCLRDTAARVTTVAESFVLTILQHACQSGIDV